MIKNINETVVSVIASVLITVIILSSFAIAKVDQSKQSAFKAGSTTNLSGLTIGGLDAAGGDGFFINSGVATSTIGAQGVPVFWTFGGIDYAYVQIAMVATSSVPCSIANPFQATSTPLWFIAQVTSGVTGSNNFSLSTSSTAFASSSPFLVLDHAVGSTKTDTMIWSPNSATTTSRILPGVNSLSGESNVVISPTDFLNWKVSTTSPSSTFSTYWTGTCSAVFVKP